KVLVLALSDRAALVAIDLRETLLDRVVGQLRFLKHAVAVGVELRGRLLERLDRDSLAGVAPGRPAGDVQQAVFADDGRHADGARDAAHGPQFGPRVEIV